MAVTDSSRWDIDALKAGAGVSLVFAVPFAFASRWAADSRHDDTLALMFMSCHPELTPASAIALTLRAVAGLATAEIAAAFLVPEATMAQRISRAKRTIKASGIAFRMPTGEEWAQIASFMPSKAHNTGSDTDWRAQSDSDRTLVSRSTRRRTSAHKCGAAAKCSGCSRIKQAASH